MQVAVVSLFPEMFTALNVGITGRALENSLIQLSHWNPRDYAMDKYRTVDDRPYGGGPGMVMKYEPLLQAIQAAKAASGHTARTIHLSPQGRLLTQEKVMQLKNEPALILVTGRYEGIDERLIETEVDEEISVGDYVLSGGELAAMVLIDAITRQLPGALGDEASAQQDSFMQGLLDCPHYTRPETVAGMQVPETLLGGNHAQIASWRLKQSLGRTWLRRPDLLAKQALTTEQKILLNEFINEFKEKGRN